MKLKSKQTGEIIEFDAVLVVKDVIGDEVAHLEYDSIQNLTDQWEDYEEPKAYYIGRSGAIEEFGPTKDVALTEMLEEIGNYFETKEEAKKAVEKLKTLKRLKDKGFRFTGWYSSGDTTNTIRIYAEFPDAELGPITGRDLALLFGGEE